jgi:LysR family transcriptional regulator, hydrogen peroxide-inducible genes activator
VEGELRLGIIPTLAPYLLPLFLKAFTDEYPQIRLHIHERTTENLLGMLKREQIDALLMVAPSDEEGFHKTTLFFEEFIVYAPKEPFILQKRYLLAEEIDPERLVLLEEGHCMRNQVINLCALQKAQSGYNNVAYEAGSLETLRRLVETHSGITILPQLALLDLNEAQIENVRFFQAPAPVREISLLSNPYYARKRVLAALKDCILSQLPAYLREVKPRQVLGIDS